MTRRSSRHDHLITSATQPCGFAVSHYRGEVHLDSVDGGTRLVWTGTFEPRIPGSGWLLAIFLRLEIGAIASRAIASRAIAVAEQDAGTDG